jgi:hypothetical protein
MVRNADGTSAERLAAFSAVAPVLQFVNGATQPSGNVGSTVIIEGQAFGDVQGGGRVLFSDGAGGTIVATIAGADDWTNAFIVTAVPTGAVTGDLVLETATGADTVTFTVTSNATFSPAQISWTQTTALPGGLSGHRAVFATVSAPTTLNVVYVTGGADTAQAATTGVYHATIQVDGQLTSWTPAPARPAPRAFHGSVVATPFNSRVEGNGFLYVLGGASDSAGTPTGTIYRAPLNGDGSLGPWIALTTTLPAPLHSAGAVVFRGEIYIAGGSTAGNLAVATVYRARIDTLGNLGAWQPLASLPTARSYHGFVTFGGHLYAFGGDSAAVSPHHANATDNTTKLSEIAYVRVNLRTGDLAAPSWTVNASALTKAASKHTAVAAGGTVLVSGGLYNGAATGSTEQSYASFNSDGSVGSFQGATGAQTIQSKNGGKDLFNHAALSYIDANGVAHVLVLGGDDVGSPGERLAGVWFY